MQVTASVFLRGTTESRSPFPPLPSPPSTPSLYLGLSEIKKWHFGAPGTGELKKWLPLTSDEFGVVTLVTSAWCPQVTLTDPRAHVLTGRHLAQQDRAHGWSAPSLLKERHNLGLGVRPWQVLLEN